MRTVAVNAHIFGANSTIRSAVVPSALSRRANALAPAVKSWSTTVGAQANVSGQQGAASYGASVNFENSRKFAFSAEGSTSVTVRLLTVPPPAQLLMLIQSS